MQNRSIAALIDALIPDQARTTHPFTEELVNCQEHLLQQGLTPAERAEILRDEWLSRGYYPCLFGRNAAKRNWISIAVLDERHLFRSDEYIRDLIAEVRLDWQLRAYRGEQHALVILAATPGIARAEPNNTMLELTLRLCDAYRGRETQPNVVYRDELFLRLGQLTSTIRWTAGIDTFAAAGDGRWWHDHRIPGGIALSVNSVGHMACKLLNDAAKTSAALQQHVRGQQPDKLLQWALPTAMRTIQQAEQKSQRPGTRLVPGKLEECPWKPPSGTSLPRAFAVLSPYSADHYHGWYHTDETVRAEFYDTQFDRPSTTREQQLDFKYLHRSTERDYLDMSVGQEVLTIMEGE